jgi:hypothetical protein
VDSDSQLRVADVFLVGMRGYDFRAAEKCVFGTFLAITTFSGSAAGSGFPTAI